MAISLQNLLDKDSLTKVWAKISDKFVRKETGKGLSTNDFTTELMNKLNGIDDNANAYTHPSHTAAQSGLYKVTIDAEGHVTNATAVGKSDITALGIPEADTTYSNMTGAGADENGTAGLVPAPDAGENTRYLRSDGTWAVPPDTDTTYNKATNSADGLLSKEDYAKLQTIAENATAVTLDEAMSTTSENGVQNKVVQAAITAAQAAALSDAKTYADGKVAGLYKYMGSVATEDELPAADAEGLENGHVYNIVAESSHGAAGMNVAWNGTGWDNLGGSFALSVISEADINSICV